MKKLMHGALFSGLFGSGFAVLLLSAQAATTCTFTTIGTVMHLDGDCMTDTSIIVPDGMTLDGNGYTITVIDPVGGFLGGVIENGGTTAHVQNVMIDAGNLANGCKGGDDRLRGILFEGASGTIQHNTILALNKGASGCQEGNGIEVRNAPFDGTHPNTQTVTIAHNSVNNWQKTGIVVNGDVTADITHNHIGDSATEANLAANSIQVGFGAGGAVTHNQVAGNQWCGPSNFVATGLLIFDAEDSMTIDLNFVNDNADVGLYHIADNASLNNNKFFDVGAADCNVNDYDWGIYNDGAGNVFTHNKIKDYELKVANVDNVAPNKGNMVIPGGPKALEDPILEFEADPFN